MAEDSVSGDSRSGDSISGEPGPITLGQLARFDGFRNPAYVAFEGRVYDVTDSPEWRRGLHRSLHWAGQDLTAYMAEAPHGPENLERFPVVGRLANQTGSSE